MPSEDWELLKKQYNFQCPSCEKKEPNITLSEDHIIPLTKGGSDYIENIQPLCRSCNSIKRQKTIKFPKIQLIKQNVAGLLKDIIYLDPIITK